MKKVILIYGLISGAIVSAMLLITQPMFRNGDIDLDNGMLFGYTTMVISLSLIFFGIKAVRDQHQNGVISFGKAFKVGILIAALASFIYATTWEVYFNTSGSDFAEWYAQCQLDQMAKDGATETELAEARVEMEEFGEMYQNPIIRFPMTLMEIFPVGLIVTLVCAAILRKREILPA